MLSEPKRTVEADEFVLRDANGLIRAVLKMTLEGPGLFFYDQSEKIRAGLVGGKDVPGLVLLDSDGKPRVSLDLAGGENADKQYHALAEACGQLVLRTNTAEEAIGDLPSWRAFTGQSLEDVKGAGWIEAVHPDDRERVVGLAKQALETRAQYSAEYRIRRHDGEYREFTVRAVPVLQADETVGEWVVAATDVSERRQLENTARTSQENLAAALHAKTQLEEALRASEESRNGLTATCIQLQESARASEQNIAALTSAKLHLEETLRSSDERINAQAAAHAHLQESLRASEESLATFTIEKNELASALRQSEETRNASSTWNAQLQESLRVSEENLSAATAARNHLEESLRLSEENRQASAAAHAQLQESLRVSEERLAALTAAHAQVEESLRVSRENHNTLASAHAELQEALRASEENHAATAGSKAQLEEALRLSEQNHQAATAAQAQLQESLRLSEERGAAAFAAKTELEESLRASHENHHSLMAASTELQQALRASEEHLSAAMSAKAQLEESLRASTDRANLLAAENAQLQESLRATEVSHSAEQTRLQDALRAAEDRLSALAAAKAQVEETLRVSGEAHAAGRKQFEEALRTSQEQLNDQIVAKGQLDETLREKEEHYKALIAATAPLVWTTNYNGELIAGAPAWIAFTGQSSTDVHGRGWFLALHPEDRERAEETLKSGQDRRSPFKIEYRVRRHDGAYRVLAVRGAPVVEYDGAVYEWISTAVDITEEKQEEIIKRASEKRYRQIVERAPEGIWIIDPENRTTFANPRLAQMLGRSEEEMPGKSLFEFLDEPGRKIAEENLSCCRRGVAMQFDLNLRTVDGKDLRTRASTLPLFDDGGQYSGALALIIDMTEQRQVESQLQQAQKLQALSQLAGGVAHGLNNFLTIISGYTDLLLGKVPRSNPLYDSVTQIKKAGEQAAGMVSPLLAFSQGQILWAKTLDLNLVVAEVEKTLRAQVGDDVRLTTVLSPSLGTVKADADQLQQVVLNLALNGLDANRGRGNLVIETRNADLDESFKVKHPEVNPGPYVHVSVTDTGVGMDAEALSHLFEPYYTTKPAGQNSGLGLSTAYGIVKQSGGLITVESEPGKGSTFHIYLPRVGETVPLTESGAPAVTTLRGTETVLVVEDQEEIRKLAQVVLKSYGYKVVVAANGWEALLYSERHVGPIHLMLTDVVMPGMTGQELAERLRPLRPEMKVIFMSGFVEHASGQPSAIEQGSGFLAKPFTPDALATKVRQALGPMRSAGVILVVDPEEETRTFMQTVLGSVGFAVLDADGGEQALKHLDNEEVDLIIVDLGKSGQQEKGVVRMFQRRRPNLKVIAMSGSFGDEFLRAADDLGARATLAKPIRADQLLDTVRRTATL